MYSNWNADDLFLVMLPEIHGILSTGVLSLELPRPSNNCVQSINS